MLKDLPNSNLNPKYRTKPRHQTRRQQRMTAQGKKIIPQPNPLNSQQINP
jgi:hypothetical protein